MTILFTLLRTWKSFDIENRDVLINASYAVRSAFSATSGLLVQGWGPRGLASTSRIPRGQNFVALALAMVEAKAKASTMLSSNTSLFLSPYCYVYTWRTSYWWSRCTATCGGALLCGCDFFSERSILYFRLIPELINRDWTTSVRQCQRTTAAMQRECQSINVVCNSHRQPLNMHVQSIDWKGKRSSRSIDGVTSSQLWCVIIAFHVRQIFQDSTITFHDHSLSSFFFFKAQYSQLFITYGISNRQ